MKMSPHTVKQGSSSNREEAMGEDCKLKELDDPADCLNRLPLARSGSTLQRKFCFLIAALLITAHRLPAPIVEQAESPTPAPAEQESAKSKPKRTKSKAVSESPDTTEKPSIHTSKPSAKSPAAMTHSRFAGIWKGTVSLGILGTTEETLTINSAGTAVHEKNHFGSADHPATWDGTTVKFSAGALNEIAFAVTPDSDGKTAIVSANSIFISNPAVTFRKEPNSETAANQVTAGAVKQAEIPTAKPDPNRPGFVYSPYDPTANRMLDVRGKASGTKAKDPISGKLFIVP